MSAAIAIPPHDHRSTSHESAHHRHYQPIAPSRGASYSQHQSPSGTSSPARPLSNMAQPSWERSRSDVPNSLSHAAPGRSSQNNSPTGSRSSDSRPPPLALPEIKTERAVSPRLEPQTAGLGPRKRPHKLDLDSSSLVQPARPSAPLTSKISGGLSSMQDVATACLSPGFDTTDPQVRHQMDRSREMAEQQRAIIAQRQQRTGGKGAESSGSKPAQDFAPPTSTFSKPAGGPLRKKAPPSSLSLGAVAALGNEPRVIQSAPLHQTFTGLQRGAHPLSRQVLEHSHQHALAYGHNTPRLSEQQPYSPQVSTPHSTRLPPISDVFANERLGSARPTDTLARTNSGPGSTSQHPSQLPAFAPINTSIDPSHHRPQPISADPSPVRPPHFDPLPATDYPRPPSNHESFLRSTALSHPSQQPLQPPEREREYRSAEEAMHSLVGGRTELLPKAVHYGGQQPPTPPSPLPPMSYASNSDPRNYHASARPLKTEPVERNDRRRTRDEFERDHEDAGADEAERDRERERRRADPDPGAAGLGFGFGALSNGGRARNTTRSPETMRRRKEEFVAICSRAWDLLQGED